MTNKVNFDDEFFILHGATQVPNSNNLVNYIWQEFRFEYTLNVDSTFDLTQYKGNGIVKHIKTGQQENGVFRPTFGFLDWKKVLLENVKFYSAIKDQI